MRELSMAIVIGAALIAWSNRYSTSDGLIVDNFTGRAWYCSLQVCYNAQVIQ